jgi:hypothetical protein
MKANSKNLSKLSLLLNFVKRRREVRPVTSHEGTGEAKKCSSTHFITPALNFVRIHNSKFYQNLSTQSGIIAAVLKPALLYCCKTTENHCKLKKPDICIEYYALINALTT